MAFEGNLSQTQKIRIMNSHKLKPGPQCLRSEKKSVFWFWAIILGQNNEGILPHTFLSSQTKNGEKNFFFIFYLKNVILRATQLTFNWSVGMKIMKLILCYCGQWLANFLQKVLLAPSSFEIFNFLTLTDK